MSSRIAGLGVAELANSLDAISDEFSRYIATTTKLFPDVRIYVKDIRDGNIVATLRSNVPQSVVNDFLANLKGRLDRLAGT